MEGGAPRNGLNKLSHHCRQVVYTVENGRKAKTRNEQQIKSHQSEINRKALKTWQPLFFMLKRPDFSLNSPKTVQSSARDNNKQTGL